ncbi:hypothetical protein E2C01_012081 [Portunus trituberculatus]|uniref:Uncharacterized protein n=1 Tax=Portunus trituberculatus TaxID=210409 RepID=A0A5B7DCJ3_PORTR|nr:hypothetical protein [Portunus trituberculatus]
MVLDIDYSREGRNLDSSASYVKVEWSGHLLLKRLKSIALLYTQLPSLSLLAPGSHNAPNASVSSVRAGSRGMDLLDTGEVVP